MFEADWRAPICQKLILDALLDDSVRPKPSCLGCPLLIWREGKRNWAWKLLLVVNGFDHECMKKSKIVPNGRGVAALHGNLADLMSLLDVFSCFYCIGWNGKVIKFKTVGRLSERWHLVVTARGSSWLYSDGNVGNCPSRNLVPGRPEPTPINEVKQKRINTPENTLRM